MHSSKIREKLNEETFLLPQEGEEGGAGGSLRGADCSYRGVGGAGHQEQRQLFFLSHLRHMEVPRLGGESELQLPAYTTGHSNAQSLHH